MDRNVWDEKARREVHKYTVCLTRCRWQVSRLMETHNRSKLLLFSELAKKYFCIPATSVPSECVFSIAGDIVNMNRASVLPENISMLVFFCRKPCLSSLIVSINLTVLFFCTYTCLFGTKILIVIISDNQNLFQNNSFSLSHWATYGIQWNPSHIRPTGWREGVRWVHTHPLLNGRVHLQLLKGPLGAAQQAMSWCMSS